MFATAYEIVSQFTSPLLTSRRFFNGKEESGVATFVIINDDGWVLTAGHVADPIIKAEQDKQVIQDYERRKQELDAEGLDPKTKKKQLRKERPPRDTIIASANGWGGNDASIAEIRHNSTRDLAAVRLTGLPAPAAYPIFGRPDALRPGTSLCRLGYPFHQVSATYDGNTDEWKLADGVLPVPRFPNEGIMTRHLLVDNAQTFFETSSPGLRGQSGGPLFDVHGVVWGIQSRTTFHRLGFEPEVQDRRGRTVVEHQFLNTGVAAHPASIRTFLDEIGIAYKRQEDNPQN